MIEIRQNRKRLIPMVVLLTLGLIGMSYFVYFSEKLDNLKFLKILYIFIGAWVTYEIYLLTKRLIKKEPVLSFTTFAIEIHGRGKKNSFSWSDITEWNIDKESDSNTYYLTVKTTDTEKKVNISWLDKTPGEIEELLLTYKVR